MALLEIICEGAKAISKAICWSTFWFFKYAFLIRSEHLIICGPFGCKLKIEQIAVLCYKA